MAKGKISAKQEEILEYIKAQTLQRGYPPAVREICDAVHLRRWRRMVIFVVIQRNLVRLRSLMMNLIWHDVRS